MKKFILICILFSTIVSCKKHESIAPITTDYSVFSVEETIKIEELQSEGSL